MLQPRLVLLCALPSLAMLAYSAEDPPLWSGTLQVGGLHAASADLGDTGSLAVDESLVEARGYCRPHPAVRAGLGVGGGLHRYDGDALDVRTEAAWLRLPVTLMGSEHWGFTSLSSIGTATDGDAPASDGRRWQVEAGLLFVRDADLLIAFSAVVNSRMGRSPSGFPLISAYWKIDPSWSLTVVDEVDNVSRLTWMPDPSWSLGLLVDVRFFEFALEHGSGGPASFSDDRAIVGLEGSWRPFADDRLAVRPMAGVAVARWITVRDADGNELSSERVDPAPAFGLSLRGDF